LKSHFQKILNSFSFLVKTTHHKSDYAATWMHQHVASLIFDFNFTKIINSLCSMFTKNT
jgi:hypothetical protein